MGCVQMLEKARKDSAQYQQQFEASTAMVCGCVCVSRICVRLLPSPFLQPVTRKGGGKGKKGRREICQNEGHEA